MPTLRESAIRLMEHGVGVETIADCLDLRMDFLTDLRDSNNISPPDEDIADAMGKLFAAAFEEAHKILREGSYAAKIPLIRLMLTTGKSIASSTSPRAMAEKIAEFRGLIEADDDEEEGVEEDIPSDVEEDVAQ